MTDEFDSDKHWREATDESVIRAASKGFKGAIREKKRRGLEDAT